MYARTIRRLLELAPNGLSNEQLLWRLRSSGLRISAEDILAALKVLTEGGEALRTTSGRWQAVGLVRIAGTPKASSNGDSSPPDGIESLLAVRFRHEDQPPAEDLGNLEEGKRADADWRALLRYYAATQRSDPRGSVIEYPDRHGLAWQLVWGNGNWWAPRRRLVVPLSACPETFREAVHKRPEKVCTIGYPLTRITSDKDGLQVVPALLLPACFSVSGDALVVDLTAAAPTLNPGWLRATARVSSSWKAGALTEALFPEGEDDDLGSVIGRLRYVLATQGAGALKPGNLQAELVLDSSGLCNAAALFLPSDARFTKGSERDLDAIAQWPEETLTATALGTLLRGDGLVVAPDTVAAPISARRLTPNQYAAALDAIQSPLTVIQGPPGTGKSEVILSLMLSMLIDGGSVLFASKNHKALDEVEHRLKGLSPGHALLVRARDADGERDTNFFAELQAVAAGPVRAASASADGCCDRLRQRGKALAEAERRSDEAQRLRLELAELTDRLEAGAPVEAVAPVELTRLRTLIHHFVALLRRTRMATRHPPDLKRKIQSGRSDLERLVTSSPDEMMSLADEIGAACPQAVAEIALHQLPPTAEERHYLADRLAELKFNGADGSDDLTLEDARRVLASRPIWAVSTLSAPSRIPLRPAMFDLVIFDEASQCDIASALPLMARARRAAVVGDPEQLSFIPQLSRLQEHALMDAAGLGKAGRHHVAQSINSLFAFARRRPNCRAHFLADQFRSDAAIVDYLNADFYQGALKAAVDDEKLKVPNGYRAGLHWLDVPGRTTRADGGNINQVEAQAVVERVVDMVALRGFTGSVGVLSPFNAQVNRINVLMEPHLEHLKEAGIDLQISTIDKFQGGEKDVIVFSTVLAEGAPASARTFYERDRRRLNVAVSRARALCLVVGDKGYARTSGIGPLVRLADWSERQAKPRASYDSQWERRLAAAMTQRGLTFFPQYSVGRRYLDFALDPDGRKLAVEVDGQRWHTDRDGGRKVSDRLRDAELRARGWTVLHFWVHELSADMEGCVDAIERYLEKR